SISFRGRLGILILAVLPALSCKKLIEIPANPPNEIPTSQVFADSSDILGSIAGVYANFKVNGGGSSITAGLVTAFTGLSSDELNYNLTSDVNTTEFMTNGLVASNPLPDQLWSTAYASL